MDDMENNLAKYELMVPQESNPDEAGNKKDLSPLLEHVLRVLGQLGFDGQTIHKDREGNWTDPQTGINYREPMTKIEIVAENTPENDSKIKTVAGAIASAADQVAVFAIKTPVLSDLTAGLTTIES